jgi:hypothetical protein
MEKASIQSQDSHHAAALTLAEQEAWIEQRDGLAMIERAIVGGFASHTIDDGLYGQALLQAVTKLLDQASRKLRVEDES